MVRGVGGRGLANIMRHCKGLRFPATKEQILIQAKQNAQQPGMPDTLAVIAVLHGLPQDATYASPADILRHLKKGD